MFLGRFEWISLFCILVQFGDLYCNHIFPCSSNPELFPTYKQPCKTLKSRRVDPLEGISACNKAFFFLSKTKSFQNLHQQVSGFAQMILPSSPTSRETLIWRFWPLQELSRSPCHFVKHLVCIVSFDMIFSLHCVLNPLTQQPCPLRSQLLLTQVC